MKQQKSCPHATWKWVTVDGAKWTLRYKLCKDCNRAFDQNITAK